MPITTTFKPTSNKSWKWKVLKASVITTKQKKLLFKLSNLLTLKEHNSAKIFKLQCLISKEYHKDRYNTISTATTSSSSKSPSTIQTEINLLKQENHVLHKRITNIKLSQHNLLSKRIKLLKSSHHTHKGYTLRKVLTKAQATFRQFTTLFNARHHLFYTNFANLINQDIQQHRSNLINTEKEKLSSTNKIHNFTATSLPDDTISGTNFIPTTSTPHISSLGHTIHSEVNSALPYARKTHHQNHQDLHAATNPTIHNHVHYHYYIRNKPDLILIFISLTMSITLFHIPKNF